MSHNGARSRRRPRSELRRRARMDTRWTGNTRGVGMVEVPRLRVVVLEASNVAPPDPVAAAAQVRL